MISIEVKKSKFMPGDYSLYLSFPYNEEILNIIRAFPNRSWHKQQKQWEVPLDMLEELLDIFSNQDIDIYGKYVDLTPREEVTSIDFDFKTKPFEHQEESFLYGMNHDKWFLGDEMGLGKTKQAIDIAVANKQNRGFQHCLIICGVNGLKWNWQEEVAIHSNEDAYILGQRTKKRTGELYIGSNKDKLSDVECLNDNPAYFIITNVESLRDEKITDELAYMVDSDVINMVIIDEAHKMKSTSSQQGKAVLKLQPEYRLIMTGTPLMNTPLDLYIILRWLGYERHSFYQFKNYYAVMGGYGGYEVIGYKHLDELQHNLDSIMLRRKKEDVLDLPEKTYIDEFVDMLPKQSVIYKEVKAEVKSNIDMLEISPNPLAEMIRMRQATGYTGILSSEVQCSAKLDRMEELVEDCISNDRKVVIFSNWTQITDVVYERLSKQYKILLVTGDTKDEERQSIKQMYQTDEEHKILVGTIGALGTGFTLTRGTVVIFLDEPWNQSLKEQAIDRVHRIGQGENVTIYTLMCKNTIDERIHELVKKKGQMSDAIVDNDYTKISKADIEYLLS